MIFVSLQVNIFQLWHGVFLRVEFRYKLVIVLRVKSIKMCWTKKLLKFAKI